MIISLQNKGLTGLKMWEATVTSSGVAISFGSVGKKPRTQTIPLSACQNLNAAEEAHKRADAKRKEGYWDVLPTGATGTFPEAKQSPSAPSGLHSIKTNEWF